MRYTYPALFTQNELDGYDVLLIDFDVMTQGNTLDDAADMAAEALYLIVDDYIENDKQLPGATYDYPLDGLLVAISIDIDANTAFVPSKKAAEMLDVSPARVRQMIGKGQLEAKKQGRNNYVYLWSVKARMEEPKQIGRPKTKA